MLIRYESLKKQRLAILCHTGKRRDWKIASSTEFPRECPFRTGTLSCADVIDFGHEFRCLGVIRTHCNCQAPLPDCGQHDFSWKYLFLFVQQPQSIKPRFRKHYCIEFWTITHFPDSGVHIAMDLDDFQIWSEALKLYRAP